MGPAILPPVPSLLYAPQVCVIHTSLQVIPSSLAAQYPIQPAGALTVEWRDLRVSCMAVVQPPDLRSPSHMLPTDAVAASQATGSDAYRTALQTAVVAFLKLRSCAEPLQVSR